MKINLLKKTLVGLSLSVTTALFSQTGNISINKAGAASTNPAILDLSDASNAHLGFLMPNVNLLSASDIVTIPSPTTGMIVWNTNAGMPFGVGYYYWSGTAWLYMLNNGSSVGNYILNQNSSQQTANFWISGTASIGAANVAADQLYVQQPTAADFGVVGANTAASGISYVGAGVLGTSNQVIGAVQGINSNSIYYAFGVSGVGNVASPYYIANGNGYGAGVWGEGYAQGVFGMYGSATGAGVFGMGTGGNYLATGGSAVNYGVLGSIGTVGGAVTGYANGLSTFPGSVGTAGMVGVANGSGTTYGAAGVNQTAAGYGVAAINTTGATGKALYANGVADIIGNLGTINNVAYTWPAAEAAANGYVLTSSTAGVLSWSNPSTSFSGNFILNQNTTQQTANFWISGTASIGAANVSTDQLYVAQPTAADFGVVGANIAASGISYVGGGVIGTSNQVIGAVQGINSNSIYYAFGVSGVGNVASPYYIANGNGYGAGVWGEGISQGVFGIYSGATGTGVFGMGTGGNYLATGGSAVNYGVLGSIGTIGGAVTGYANGLSTFPGSVGTAGMVGVANGNGTTYGTVGVNQNAAGYGLAAINTTGTTGNGLFVSGVTYHNGKVGIGTPAPVNNLDVTTGVAVGTYAGVNAAPANGMIVSGQVSVGNNTPNTKAIVDLTNATNLGFMLPGMSTANLPVITPAQNGLMVFNTTIGCPEYASGGTWYVLGVSHGSQTFTYTSNTISTFVVPGCVAAITIVASGGAGAAGADAGGNGAVVTATVAVTPGHTLDIVCGNVGTNPSLYGGGGGGGTFVWDNASTATPIVVAGGGGGGGGTGAAGLPGSTTTTANNSGNTTTTGVAAGGAGGSWATAVGNPAAATTHLGQGGVGEPAGTPFAGGLGSTVNPGGVGGYGGGGGGGSSTNAANWGGAGGGGGFNGGGGGNGTNNTATEYGGGGGGSCVNGANPGTVTQTNTGAGSVVITW